MQTIAEVVDSSQEVLLQAFQKQAPRRGISAVGASSPPPIARIRDLRGITAMAQLALYCLLAREPNIFPGMTTLAADMKKSVRTAQRAVRELERAGYVQVIHRTSQTNPRINQTNLYVLTIPGAATHSRIHAMHPACQCDTTPMITGDTTLPPPMSPPW